MEFKDWLAAAMEQRGLTVRGMASLIGVDHTTLRGWIQGRGISWAKAGVVAEALGEDPAYVRSSSRFTTQ